MLKGDAEMKLERLMSITMMLLDKKRISAKALAETFEVSLRTIYRDIESITKSGIPIHATSGVGGGFEIMPDYKIDRQVFSTADLSAILMGLSGLSNMIRGDELINALAKVKSFIPAAHSKAIEVKTNQIHIDLNPWLGNQNIRPALELIKQALQENQILSFTYVDRHSQQTSRTVEPCQLVLKGNHWYLYSFCLKRQDFRLFRLSRILNLHLNTEHFLPRAFQKPQLDFTTEITTMQTPIKLRIHHSILDRVLAFCSLDHFTPDGEAHYLVDFPFIENDYYYDRLFSFGDQCECLAPLAVRQEVQRRLSGMISIYQN